jgi:CheY-like chemotaxis protein
MKNLSGKGLDPTILLVDDEPSITKALRRIFRKDGYRIFTANSGPEAPDLLVKNSILKDSTIKTIQEFGQKQLIENKVYVIA